MCGCEGGGTSEEDHCTATHAGNSYLDYARNVRKEALSVLRNQIWTQVALQDVSKVVPILASSRSGSSLLFELLRHTEQILSLDGEHVPYYKLNGYSFPVNSLRSDRIDSINIAAFEHFDDISRDFISGLGVGTERQQFRFKDFAHRLTMRLPLQWPQLALSREEWLWYSQKAYELYQLKHHRWNTDHFFIELLRCLGNDHRKANPFYYDIPKHLIRASVPQYTRPQGPPNPYFCIEEPPFITIVPRRCPTPAEIRSKPLLLKASIDAYRLPLLKKLFPKSEFKIVHLTRNPAATINGLYDGWLDRGFFSHNLKGVACLSISGYTDIGDWGKYWWNYDLPPDWERMTGQPLEYVCGFQWHSAHVAILESLAQEGQTNALKVRFEDLLSSTHRRRLTISKILRFIGIEFDRSLQSIVEKIPVVMATTSPSKRRWVSRKDMIWPVVTQKPIVELARSLGYPTEEEDKWL